MGQLINGQWIDDAGMVALSEGGEWQRTPSIVRNWIGADSPDFPAEPGRYRLYAAWNCPWAHRVLLTRALLGLEDVIPVSFTSPSRNSNGWVFDQNAGYVNDLFGSSALHEIYIAGEPGYTGRVSVPLLYDTKTNRLVSNESADLVRMLPQAFATSTTTSIDLYPKTLRSEIDRWNDRIHSKLNNGVYRAGFSESQSAYEAAVEDVFETLDTIEERLVDNAYLVGDKLTEADVRLFPTLARFDVAYFGAFKCSRRRVCDYRNIWKYARKFYARDGIADTVKFDIYRRGYFSRSEKRNPLGIIPIAPDIDWTL